MLENINFILCVGFCNDLCVLAVHYPFDNFKVYPLFRLDSEVQTMFIVIYCFALFAVTATQHNSDLLTLHNLQLNIS